MDPKAMLALYNQTAPEMGLDLELQVENVLKAPGMAQVCDLLSSIPSTTLASGSLALLATGYLCHRSRKQSPTSPSTTTTITTSPSTLSIDLTELTAEYESRLRVQAKKSTALQAENAALKETHAAYRKESFARSTRVVQLVSEAHLRTEEGLRARICGLEMEMEKPGMEEMMGSVIEMYAKEAWALKRENKDLVSKNAELETENRDTLAMLFDGNEDGANQGVVAENAKLKAENTQLKIANTDLEARNAHLKERNTELLTHDVETEAENIELKNRNTALRSLNTELVSQTSELENELSTPHNNAALSENKGLQASLREAHKVIQRAEKRYIAGVQQIREAVARANEEHRTELDKKDKEITALHANLTLKAANEAILQKKLKQIAAELASKADENVKMDAMASKALDGNYEQEQLKSEEFDTHTSHQKRRVHHPQLIAHRVVLTHKERTTRFEHQIQKASIEDGVVFDGIDCQDLARETRGWVRRDIDRAVDVAIYRARGEAMKHDATKGGLVVTKDHFRDAVQQVREFVRLEGNQTLKGEKDTTVGSEGSSKTPESRPSSSTTSRDRSPSTPEQRLALFKEYRTRDIPRQTTIDWSKTVAITDGFRGRDVQDTLNQAMVFAHSKKRDIVSQYDLEQTIRRLRTERSIPKGAGATGDEV